MDKSDLLCCFIRIPGDPARYSLQDQNHPLCICSTLVLALPGHFPQWEVYERIKKRNFKSTLENSFTGIQLLIKRKRKENRSRVVYLRLINGHGMNGIRAGLLAGHRWGEHSFHFHSGWLIKMSQRPRDENVFQERPGKQHSSCGQESPTEQADRIWTTRKTGLGGQRTRTSRSKTSLPFWRF